MFFAIQAIAESGSDKMGDMGLIDLDEKTDADKLPKPPNKPLMEAASDFLPKPSLPWQSADNAEKAEPPSRFPKDFFAAASSDASAYFPLLGDDSAATSSTWPDLAAAASAAAAEAAAAAADAAVPATDDADDAPPAAADAEASP